MGFDWKKAVTTVAPMLGTALGGPMIGGAIGVLEQCFGLTPDAGASLDDRTSAVAAAAVGATPEQWIAVQKANQDFAVQMAALGFKNVETLAQLAVQDRDSARQREIKTGDVWTPRLLAAVVVIGWLCVQGLVLTTVIDQSMRELAARLLGTLDAALMSVLYYYFGGSAGSDRKTDIIAASAHTDAKGVGQ